MNAEQITLYKNLRHFSLDQLGAQFPFSKRLARDNRWSLRYARRVVEEYKRFTLLAVTAGHPVTPSDQVDQVWHLHLTYTRNYWEVFCPDVLQTVLHHSPTQGGSDERQKFDQWYIKTLSSYQRLFNERPPSDIWPKPQDRFGRDLNFVRVNTQQNWLFPKNKLRTLLASRLKLRSLRLKKRHAELLVGVSLTLLIVGCRTVPSDLPHLLDLGGAGFLIVYSLLSLIAICLSVWIRDGLTHYAVVPSKWLKNRSVYEIAALSGGRHNIIRTVALCLMQKGCVAIQPHQNLITSQKMLTLTVPLDSVTNPIEREVVEGIDAYASGEDVSKNLPLIDKICEETRADYIAATLCSSLLVKFLAVFPILLLLLLGLIRMSVGLDRDQPIGWLVIIFSLLILYLIGFLQVSDLEATEKDRVMMWPAQYRRTHGYSYQDSRLLKDFALLGDISLPEELEVFKHIDFDSMFYIAIRPVIKPAPQSRSKPSRRVPISGSSTSSGGDDGGDGGCGDGGCGGCGGGG